MEELTQLDEYKLEVESRYNDYLSQVEHRDISMGEIAYIEGLTEDELDEFSEDLEEAIIKGE